MPDKCINDCNIRNSTCSVFSFDSGAPVCGCFYCNYDPNSKSCVGQCSYRNINKPSQCIQRVQKPKSDADCQCATYCEPPVRSNGKYLCRGKCGKTGLSCKHSVLTLAFTNVDVCTCQK